MSPHPILSWQIVPEHEESIPEAKSDVATELGSTGCFPIEVPSTTVLPRQLPRTRTSTV